MLVVKHVIAHLLQKNQHNTNAHLELSDNFMLIDDAAQKLVEELNNRYDKQNASKITYAKFGTPTIFSQTFGEFHSALTDSSFIAFSKESSEALLESIKSVPAAKGGYVIFAHYEATGGNFVGVYIIREKKGVLFIKDANDNSFKINDAIHIDFEKIAMGCRINKDNFASNRNRYLSFIDSRKEEVSKFFTDWVSADDNADNVQDTKELLNLLRNMPKPIDESGIEISTEALLSKAYSFIKEQPGRIVDLTLLSQVLYQSESVIFDYLTANNLQVNGTFKADPATLRRFATVKIAADKISLSFPLSSLDEKVRINPDQPNIIIIESQALAEKLREDSYNF